MIGRRDLLSAAGGALAPRAAPLPEAGHPDGALIALCRLHVLNHVAFNRAALDAPESAETRRLWDAYVASHDAIGDARPRTFAGLAAKALAARQEALTPDGHEEWEDGTAVRWGADLARDILRLAHEGAGWTR